jgi:methylenetetrahydrofolate reductase (NADPH)
MTDTDNQAANLAVQQVAEAAAELVRNGSIERSSSDPEGLKAAGDLLPRGTSVYLPWPAARPFSSRLEPMREVCAAGFDPVPHLAARNIPSSRSLLEFLDRATSECQVRRVMLIGGDQAEPVGPWASAVELLESGVLQDRGVHEVGVAGFPEGHPHLPAGRHFEFLERKFNLAAAQGLGLEVITQFSFLPHRITEYCAELVRALPDLPVYAGLAGPAPESVLRRYARYCGVSASIRALTRLGVKAGETVHLDPEKQLAVMAHFNATRHSSNLVGVHVFSFGGFGVAAQWYQQQMLPGLTRPGPPTA